jgi:predicted enzyme related to lactoylglutathione lyase
MTTHPGPWPTGTPAWADITVPSLDDARAFYGPLLGWEFEEGGPEAGGYTVATIGGRRVAGLGEAPPDAVVQPAWCVYLSTDDARATLLRAATAGARVLIPATTIPRMGTMAIAVDPTGAVFGLWESHHLTGWDATDEPGAVVWSEVMSDDQPLALAFYREVFDLDAEDVGADGFVYASLRHGDSPVAGVGASEAGSAWTLYFAVPDVDTAAARVVELGGTVLGGPFDSPFGRNARVRGPFGETFAIITPA